MNFFNYVKELARTVMDKDPAAKSMFVSIFLTPGVKALSYYYIAHHLYSNNHFILAMWLSHRARRVTGIEIHPGASIGRRTMIDHGMGIVIGETAIIEDDVNLFHGVTLGGVSSVANTKRHPTVRKGVTIGASSIVLGDIEIGENSKIGANSVVLQDIGPNVTAVGTPAKVVRYH